jgi:hypothetical protein
MKERFLKLLLPEPLIGDLRETGKPFGREIAIALIDTYGAAIMLGVIGGLALIVTTLLTNIGPRIYWTYAAIFVVMCVNRRATMLARLVLFMTATFVIYGYVWFITGNHISLLGHAWRLGFMLAIGIFLSWMSAALTVRRAKLRAR